MDVATFLKEWCGRVPLAGRIPYKRAPLYGKNPFVWAHFLKSWDLLMEVVNFSTNEHLVVEDADGLCSCGNTTCTWEAHLDRLSVANQERDLALFYSSCSDATLENVISQGNFPSSLIAQALRNQRP